MDEIRIDKLQLATAATTLMDEGYRLETMVASDERHMGNGFTVRYIFSKSSGFTILTASSKDRKPVFKSVAQVLPSANWYEREAADLLGIVFEGHPDPRPLVYHGAWPEGEYPLRKDFHEEDHSPVRVGTVPGGGYIFEGSKEPGAMEIPVGPIHAGIIEPGHFRFSAMGETVNKLEARLFFTHRGVEKAAEGMDVRTGLMLAERVCGACSFSHSLSFSQAAEEALGIGVTRRTRLVRTMLMELERLYNHVGDVGNICAGVGLAFGISHLGRLKERLMSLNETVAGNRFLRGINDIGGLRRDLSAETLNRIKGVTGEVMKEFTEITEVVMESDSFLDRINGTGILEREVARELGAVGVAARASGVDSDSRRDNPHAAYGEVEFSVPVGEKGDVASRISIRIKEAEQSRLIIRQLADILEKEASDTGSEEPVCHRSPLWHGPGYHSHNYRTGLGISESARGSNIHWLMLDGHCRIERLRIRSASFCNWPVVPHAVPGNIVPDFPLINKSFELCYSCLDR